VVKFAIFFFCESTLIGRNKKTAKEQPLLLLGEEQLITAQREEEEKKNCFTHVIINARLLVLERERERERVCVCVCCTSKNKNNAEKQNETTQAQRQSRPQVPAQTETPSDVFSHARGRFIRRVSRTGETWDGEPNRVKRGRAGDGEVLLQSDREALRKRVGVEESHQDEKV